MNTYSNGEGLHGSASFSINGNTFTVHPGNDDISPNSLLVDYIRDNAGLKGTKYLCREGGCGACLVSVQIKNTKSGEERITSVPSCLVRTLSCHGWKITTIEDLGNKRDGYHQIQKRLENFCGTQCGYCTPGMVMNMYSLLHSLPGDNNLTVKNIEDNFDGNICRCTGYRSIMDAFKSFAVDAPQEILSKCPDIEDFKSSCGSLKNDSKCCQGLGQRKKYATSTTKPILSMNFSSGTKWIKVVSLPALFGTIKELKSTKTEYRFVAGNTAVGIFKTEETHRTYIDISQLSEILESKVDETGIILGGGITITETIRILKTTAAETGFSYANTVIHHFSQRVGNHHIRNIATLAGNLMLKYTHSRFASDIYMIFEALSAKIVIASAPEVRISYSVAEFLASDMEGKVIVSIQLPPLSDGHFLKTYKVSPRYQNSKSYLNAAFLFKIDVHKNYTVLQRPQIIYGGVNETHANKTEEFLIGKVLNDNATLKLALEYLSSEIITADFSPASATPEYRHYLTQALFYKAILSILGGNAKLNIQSGGLEITRNVSSGKQIYEKDNTSQVLYQGMPKLETLQQCSGEAEYVNDINPQQNELFGAFVLSTVANADLKSIDATKALKMDGVVKFVCAKDIPGINNYMIWEPQTEEVFISGKVQHAGQPIGVILAESRSKAFAAAKNVTVVYENIRKPVLTIKDALNKAEKERSYEKLLLKVFKSEETSGVRAVHTLKGEMKIGGQHHFQMEPHVTICIPKEGSMDVFCATQWMDRMQAVVSSVLNCPSNTVNVQVRRLGGGFGGKITRSGHIAAACAVGSYVTNRSVRIALDLETHMRMIGKKLPYLAQYEVGISEEGKIVSLHLKVFCDPGFSANEETTMLFMMNIQNCYEALGWEVTTGRVLTNTPANTYCRAPGHTQGTAVIENIMEHIAHFLKKDPWEVRRINMIQKGHSILFTPSMPLKEENPLETMLQNLKTTADYSSRVEFIESFNKANHWKKRGLALVPMRFPNHYIGGKYSVFIAIYYIDGTVAISHGGIEMGQGLNTKIAQTVAEILNIPLANIRVKPSNTVTAANSSLTAAGTTSESCCFAAAAASKILLDRMAPVMEKMGKASWIEIVKQCSKENIDLTASYMNSPKDNIQPYEVWGLNLTEVEVDLLTGEYNTLRIDFVIDGGKSLNPEIDIGQIEGSLVMGLGLWTTEKLVYDENTGQLLTNGTWDYKPPETKDIPEDFRITLLNDTPNRFGVLSSKGAGEPPLCTSVCVVFAIKNAIDSFIKEAGYNKEWYQIDGPVTPEDVHRYALISPSNFIL